jgi:hypothetical protein
MTTFVLAYRVPPQRLDESLAELDDAGRAARLGAWNSWLDTLGSNLIERGEPINDARAVGNCGPDTRIGGYSIVSAPDMEAALEIARGCPAVERGGGVEIGEILELPLDRRSLDAESVAG